MEVGEARVEVETCSGSDAPSWRRSEDGNGANTQKDRREEVEVTSPCKPVTIGKEVEKLQNGCCSRRRRRKMGGRRQACWRMEKMRTNLVMGNGEDANQSGLKDKT